MNDQQILAKLKQIIAKTAGLKPERMGDGASLREELGLDSLSLLEIAFDVDLAFGLGLPDERYKDVQTLPDMVALVATRLAELAAEQTTAMPLPSTGGEPTSGVFAVAN